jgi:prepilin-type N-terminal cleavage/methylation domain-containing protein
MVRYKLPKIPHPSSEQLGFTIVESLVAILVVSILLAAIAPVIVLSVATRLQAKRVETSVDAAKKFVDALRTGEISSPPNPAASFSDFQGMSAPPGSGLNCPTSNALCATQPATDYSLFCVNDDTTTTGCSSSNLKSFVIQAYAYNGATSSPSITTGYTLRLRVYRPDAFADSKALETVNKPLTYAAGLGDRKAPLLELTTDIAPGVVFSNFCNRLKSPTSNAYTPGSTYNSGYTPGPTPQSQC